MEQRCILIADDDADIREVLRLYLENAGYRVVEAADGLLGGVVHQLDGLEHSGIAEIHRLVSSEIEEVNGDRDQQCRQSP